MKKEQIHVIERDDGKIKLCYWNKGIGETSIIVSKIIARRIQKGLKNMLSHNN